MIPLRLSISGLYSYQQEQTIDFTRLLDGQIFGIFGAVGSGKSSILEAITYALYGESERLNKQDKRSYNMMNLKSDELSIDFTFRNFDGKDYRFAIQAKRHGSKFEEVRSAKRQAWQLKNGEWMPLPHTDAGQILGLSYDNFRRTIIIPQGKFQDFLQLGDKARTDMMKEIFSLEKYEFYYQTTSLEKKNEEKIQLLEGQLIHFEEATKEAVEAMQKELSDLEKELKRLKNERNEKEETWKRWSDLEKLVRQQEEIKDQIDRLKKQKPTIDQHRQLITKYEQALQQFKGIIERQAEWDETLANLENESNNEHEKQSKISGNLKKLEAIWPELQHSYQSLDQQKIMLLDLDQILKIEQKEAELATLSSRLEKSVPAIEQASLEHNAIEKLARKLKLEVKTLKEKQVDIKELYQARQWQELVREKRRLVENHRKQQVELAQKVATLLPSLDESWGDLNAVQTEFRLTELLTKCKKEIEQLQEKLARYQLDARLGEFVDRLNEGAPCPLCGAKEHPEILSVQDVSDHLASGRESLSRLRKKENDIGQALQVARETHASLSTLDNQKIEINRKMTPFRDKMKVSWLEKWSEKSLESIEGEIEQAELQQEQLETKVNQWQKAVEEQEQTRKNMEKYKLAQSELERKADECKAGMKTLQDQLQLLDAEKSKEGEDVLSREKKNIEREISEITKKYEQTRQDLQTYHQELRIVEENLKRIDASRKEAIEKQSSLQKKIEQQLDESEFTEVAEVKELLALDLDLNKIKDQITSYDQEMYNARQRLKETDENLKGEAFDPGKMAQVKAVFDEAVQLEEKFQERTIRTRSTLEKMRQDLTKKYELEKQKEILDQRKSNLKLLKNLFKGSGFVNYISSVYLHNLCEAANDRFYSLTRQQLRLEVDENNAFQVRDFMNDGRVRSVKTLSGGQTFQAALSLALALAESVQQQNQAEQNFFFLDEGFGALDEESLQVVFETLKALRKENRIVGVISHVDALQQEIDMFLHIHNDSERGSLIKASWE